MPAPDAVPILEADLTGALDSLQSACESIGQHVGTVMGELDALLAGAAASEAEVPHGRESAARRHRQEKDRWTSYLSRVA